MVDKPENTTVEPQPREVPARIAGRQTIKDRNRNCILTDSVEFVLKIYRDWLANVDIRVEMQVSEDLWNLEVDSALFARSLEIAARCLSAVGHWLLICRNLRLLGMNDPEASGMVEIIFSRKPGNYMPNDFTPGVINEHDLVQLRQLVTDCHGDMRVQRTNGFIECVWLLFPAADHQDR